MTGRRRAFDKVITVDCRELEPPEPMVRVLEAVESMADGEAVLMLHRQKPCLLLPRLDEMGLEYELAEKEDGSVELLIWRR